MQRIEAAVSVEVSPGMRRGHSIRSLVGRCKAEGDAQAARGWLTRAAQAPLAGRWRCTTCGNQQPEYTPLCPACGAFDSQTPAERPPPLDLTHQLIEPASETG